MSLADLDSEHLDPLRRAIRNILLTPIAEETYGQIIDGLPLHSVYEQDHACWEDAPVMEHTELCAGVLQKTRDFCSTFDILYLDLDIQTIQAYQNTGPGCVSWKLRLLELVAMACHDIAIRIYQLDDGVHKHKDWTEWHMAKVASLSEEHEPWDRVKCGTSIPFFVSDYQKSRRYPNGSADVVGYWAEHRIFGGVVLFDRGPTQTECNGVYLRSTKTTTLAPPTEKQFNDLNDLLMSPEEPSEDTAKILPIEITSENRWRWHHYRGMVEHHIYKYSHEIPGPEGLARQRYHPSKLNARDWPELNDQALIMYEARKEANGEPFDQALMDAAEDRLVRTITPDSRFWKEYEEEIVKSQPDERTRGRPPYFSDP